MQDPPEKEVLLFAIARFLEQDIRPLVKDPRLNFRVLIATHLAATVANECRTSAADEAAALVRLRAIYPDAGDAPFRTLEAQLARDIRDDRLEPAAMALAKDHVRKSLFAKLAVNSPRFDTSPTLETE
jgi:hypothetical protein